MLPAPSYPLRVFYDGSCGICAVQMEFYRHRERTGRLQFVDISGTEFDPAPYGIPLAAFRYEMHAIDGENRVYRGVDAFRAIWQAFPTGSRYGLLGTLIALPGVHLIARGCYWCFARVRRFLPQSRDACRDGTCGLGQRKPLP
jgi:predicted DCC family thiol-disulfide oxidoreductase YuxK